MPKLATPVLMDKMRHGTRSKCIAAQNALVNRPDMQLKDLEELSKYGNTKIKEQVQKRIKEKKYRN